MSSFRSYSRSGDVSLPKGVFRLQSRAAMAPLPPSLGPSSLEPSLLEDMSANTDPAFPFGLGEQGVHEICERVYGDKAPCLGFVAAGMGAAKGVTLWVTQRRVSMDHGRLLEIGWRDLLTGQRTPIIHVAPARLCDVLWTVEEAITSGAVARVVADLDDMDFTASRRLSLASVRCGVPVVLLMSYGRQGASAASARWRVSPTVSAPNRFDAKALGSLRWRAVLERTRTVPYLSGKTFDIELNDETLSVCVAPGMAANAVAPYKEGQSTDQPINQPIDWRQAG